MRRSICVRALADDDWVGLEPKSSRSNILRGETIRELGGLLLLSTRKVVSTSPYQSASGWSRTKAILATAKGGRAGESAYFVGVSFDVFSCLSSREGMARSCMSMLASNEIGDPDGCQRLTCMRRSTATKSPWDFHFNNQKAFEFCTSWRRRPMSSSRTTFPVRGSCQTVEASGFMPTWRDNLSELRAKN